MKSITINKYTNIIVKLDESNLLDEICNVYNIIDIKKHVTKKLSNDYKGKTVEVVYIRYIEKDNGIIRYRGDNSFNFEIS